MHFGKYFTRSKKESMSAPRSSLRFFRDISGYEGVFVSGPYPHWLMLTARGELRCHPMSIDGSVSCFAPFHNVNCPNGFLYFNRKVREQENDNLLLFLNLPRFPFPP